MEIPENRFLKTVRAMVNAQYSVPTWLWVIVSLTLGLTITGYAYFNPAEIAEFLNALPFSGKVIGPLLTFGAAASMIGMVKKRALYVQRASFLSFLVWVFVAFAFYGSGGWVNVLILPLPMLCFWGYKYLASYVREHPQL